MLINKRNIRVLTSAFFCLLWLAMFSAGVSGGRLIPQIGKTGKGVKTDETKSKGIGKTGKGMTGAEENKPVKPDSVPVIKPVITTIKVIEQPRLGFLAIVTTPQADVTIRSRQLKLQKTSNQDGELSLPPLAPGRYQLEIRREDYEPFTYSILIEKGQQKQLTRFLTSKYGTIKLGLGEQADSSVSVQLDDELLPASRLKIEKGMISIPRVPVGPHRLRVSKDGYDDYTIDQFEVRPGEQNEKVFTLLPITITLSVKTLPNAQIYLDGVLKARSGADGMASVPDLLPGTKRLRVVLDGYETVEREVTFSREQRQAGFDIRLNPITEDAEFSESFNPTIDNWGPKRSVEWELVAGKGLKIRGEQVGLCKNTSKPNRPYNYYYDFNLRLNVSFTNGKGAAWVVRARDKRNYYLFELTNACDIPGKKCLNFYVIRDGELKLVESPEVFVPLDRPGDSFLIILEARGHSFSHWIEVNSTPGRQRLGRVFEDDTFAYGGIGFRAINGLEMFVNQVLVQPLKR